MRNHTPLRISRDQLQMSFLWQLRWAKMARNNSLEYRLGTLGNCGHLILVQLARLSGWGEVGLTESSVNASPAGYRKNVSFKAFRFPRTHIWSWHTLQLNSRRKWWVVMLINFILFSLNYIFRLLFTRNMVSAPRFFTTEWPWPHAHKAKTCRWKRSRKNYQQGAMRNTSVLATFTEVRSGRSAPLSFLV